MIIIKYNKNDIVLLRSIIYYLILFLKHTCHKLFGRYVIYGNKTNLLHYQENFLNIGQLIVIAYLVGLKES